MIKVVISLVTSKFQGQLVMYVAPMCISETVHIDASTSSQELCRAYLGCRAQAFRSALSQQNHVQLGNSPYRMDMQAARNFATLIWAAEPKLSVLHVSEIGSVYLV
ncbi:hypothetical protein BKA56DRAFT_624975 [Ilyonectria sp. MPI-CAGE-AT-0026]|nr:hypothetical protein BKA56DRAFT_624975 [Ilyonectria sp. MPI-CAGE-AT-0026]